MAGVATLKRPLTETQMLHQKVYVRSSRGRATKVTPYPVCVVEEKVVREHYLRTDIPCGSELCSECTSLISQTQVRKTGNQPPNPSTPVFVFQSVLSRFPRVAASASTFTSPLRKRALHHSRHKHLPSLRTS